MHQYGLGQFFYKKGDIGSDYINNRSETISNNIQAALDALHTEDIKTNASIMVAVTEYWNQAKKLSIIHLVNYDYDIVKDCSNKQTSISMEVALNPGLLGKALDIYFDSPDTG